ncbi:hypothetical protein DFJ74DRAFT_695495 [Hyaloraphidium curvatum]|nr:hypothetical protein DFJ74DRAFT_695495 [Hyaloraphidium curvatum]
MASSRNSFDVVLYAGISGICAGYYLKCHCPDRTFAILEGRDSIGGTWDLLRCSPFRTRSNTGPPRSPSPAVPRSLPTSSRPPASSALRRTSGLHTRCSRCLDLLPRSSGPSTPAPRAPSAPDS